MLCLRGKSSLGDLCELGFEPQRARENGRKSSPMLRLRGKSSLCDLRELGGDIFILWNDSAPWRGETVWRLDESL